MTVAAIPGAVRQRFIQLGIQSALQTAVTPTRRVPWRGIPVYNPNVTDPDVDVGSLDPVLLPYAMAVDADLTATGILDFDNAAIRLSAGLKGGVSGSTASGATTWTHQVASLTSDVFDVYTVQQADDTEATDAITAFGGVIDVLEETLPEDGGPWTINDQWIFAGETLGQNATDGIVIDESPEWVFGTDTAFYKDTTAGSIGNTQWSDIHSASIRVSNNLDRKRFQNGSNSRFTLTGYGRGPREIELVITASKNATAIAERASFDDTPRVNRFFKIPTTSTELIGSTVRKYERWGAFRLFEVADVEVGNNAAIQFTYHGYYSASLGYSYKTVLVNTLATLP